MVPDQLRIVLTLAAGAATVTLVAGAVEELDLTIEPWAFEGRLLWRVLLDQDEDGVWDVFTSDATMTVSLSVASTVLDGTDAPDDEDAPLKVTGYVTARRLREQPSDETTGQPLVERRYELWFVDPAAYFWRQHRPIELRTESSFATTLAAHQAPGMTVAATGSALAITHPVLCIATDERTSFYDWSLWMLDRLGGALELDVSSNTYRFTGERSRPTGTPTALDGTEIGSLRLLPAEPLRHASRVRNADAEAHATVDLASPIAAMGVWRESLVRSPLITEPDAQRQRETRRLRPGSTGIEVTFLRCPTRLVAPGSLVTFDDEVSHHRLGARSPWRVRTLRLAARPVDEGATAEMIDPVRAFGVTASMTLEAPLDPRPRLPAFTPPGSYPVRVEGRIVSEGGDDDRTWMTPIDAQDSRARYQVKIPLWNRQVPSLFLPGNVPGHLFFPAYKDERVLVGLHLHEARIERFLDWAPTARLPATTQGNHLLFGLQEHNATSVSHTFVDDLPVLTVRRTFGNDLQTVIFEEGRVFLEVREDPTAIEITPRHDVSVVVAAAREQLNGAINGAIGEVTGSFEGTASATSAKLDGAIEEVTVTVTGSEEKLLGRIASVDATLAELEGSLGASLGELSAAVASARAALAAALDGA